MKIVGRLGKDKLITNTKLWHVDLTAWTGFDVIKSEIEKNYNSDKISNIVDNNISLVMKSSGKKFKCGSTGKNKVMKMFGEFRRIKHKDVCIFYRYRDGEIEALSINHFTTKYGILYIVLKSDGRLTIFSSHFADRMIERFGYKDRYDAIRAIVELKYNKTVDGVLDLKNKGGMIKMGDMNIIVDASPDYDVIYHKTVYTDAMLSEREKNDMANSMKDVELNKLIEAETPYENK